MKERKGGREKLGGREGERKGGELFVDVFSSTYFHHCTRLETYGPCLYLHNNHSNSNTVTR